MKRFIDLAELDPVAVRDLIGLAQRLEASPRPQALAGKVLGPFADHYAFPYPLLLSDERMRAGQSAFGRIRALPSTVLLDRHGRAVAAWQGIEGQADVAKAIEKLLKAD